MSKTILYKIFDLGKVPKSILPQLKSEGLVLIDEGLSGTVTLRNFRSPRRRSSWRRSWFSGSLVLTEERFWAFTYFNPVVSVAIADQKFSELKCSVGDNSILEIEFEISHFQPDSSGLIVCRYKTSLARQFVELLQSE